MELNRIRFRLADFPHNCFKIIHRMTPCKRIYGGNIRKINASGGFGLVRCA